MATPLQGTQSSSAVIERVSYTHDAMIDLILGHPGITEREIAKYFGYSYGWVTRVFNSDAFNKRLAERKTEVIDVAIVQATKDRIQALADTSLGYIQERLEKLPEGQVKDTMAMKAADLSVKAMGFGARDRNQAPAIQQTFVVALPSKAPDESTWVKGAEGRHLNHQSVVVDVEARS